MLRGRKPALGRTLLEWPMRNLWRVGGEHPPFPWLRMCTAVGAA
jgi:hypothetical protein